MKKIILLLFWFIFLTIDLRSQTSDYNSIISYLQKNTKENTQNRIIAINVWSASDKNSRDANMDLNNTCNVFSHAKLKGGDKGIIGVVICLDNDDVTSNITLKKDGINNLIIIHSATLSSLAQLSKKPSSYNVVFDSNGNMLFENIAANSIFNSIRNLITR